MNDCVCVLDLKNNHFQELNIIGCFKLNENEKRDCCRYEYEHDHIDSDNDNDNRHERDIGFSLLSNRDQVTQYLKKTKFCQIMIEKGFCHREVCNFAHSMKEFVFPDCAFKENCRKKTTCGFKHPNETLDSYKARIRFIVPKNIEE